MTPIILDSLISINALFLIWIFMGYIRICILEQKLEASGAPHASLVWTKEEVLGNPGNCQSRTLSWPGNLLYFLWSRIFAVKHG